MHVRVQVRNRQQHTYCLARAMKIDEPDRRKGGQSRSRVKASKKTKKTRRKRDKIDNATFRAFRAALCSILLTDVVLLFFLYLSLFLSLLLCGLWYDPSVFLLVYIKTLHFSLCLSPTHSRTRTRCFSPQLCNSKMDGWVGETV